MESARQPDRWPVLLFAVCAGRMCGWPAPVVDLNELTWTCRRESPSCWLPSRECCSPWSQRSGAGCSNRTSSSPRSRRPRTRRTGRMTSAARSQPTP